MEAKKKRNKSYCADVQPYKQPSRFKIYTLRTEKGSLVAYHLMTTKEIAEKLADEMQMPVPVGLWRWEDKIKVLLDVFNARYPNHKRTLERL